MIIVIYLLPSAKKLFSVFTVGEEGSLISTFLGFLESGMIASSQIFNIPLIRSAF